MSWIKESKIGISEGNSQLQSAVYANHAPDEAKSCLLIPAPRGLCQKSSFGPRGAGIRRLTGRQQIQGSQYQKERLIRHTGCQKFWNILVLLGWQSYRKQSR